MAALSMLLTIGLLLIGPLQSVTGSKIVVTSSPRSIQPSLTKTLNLNCSLEDTTNPSVSGLVGRSVTNTTFNVAHVTSILITRDGNDVASITPYTSAKPMSDLANLKVTGDVTGSFTTRGFLYLSWTYPSDQEIGEFTCEIAAVTNTGHTTVFSKTLQVDVMETTNADMKLFVNQLETRLTALETEMKTKDNQITALETEMKTKDNQIFDVLDEVKKRDSGNIQCGDSANGGWYTDGNWKARNVTVQFKTSYRNPPIVDLSIMELYIIHYNDDDNGEGLDLLDVNTHSFTMRCRIWHTFRAITMSASWVSFPQF